MGAMAVRRWVEMEGGRGWCEGGESRVGTEEGGRKGVGLHGFEGLGFGFMCVI